MQAAVYIRISSAKGQKTDSQRAELEAWLRRQPYKVMQWFEDRESATTVQRDAVQKLQAAIFANHIEWLWSGSWTVWPAQGRRGRAAQLVPARSAGDRHHAADRFSIRSAPFQ